MCQSSMINGVEVGRRLRLARINRGMSILELCEQLGSCECEWLERYEAGQAVISAIHLKILAVILDVPVEFFLHDQPLMESKDDLQLLRWFRSLEANQRAHVLQLVADLKSDAAISDSMPTSSSN